MTRVRLSRLGVSKAWQFVTFLGKNGAESRGIVDAVAIRRDHNTDNGEIRPGDFFEIILIQIKGGSAPWPSTGDVARLRAVQRRYHARSVVLAAWKKGSQVEFWRLRRTPRPRDQSRRAWWLAVPAEEVFGKTR